MTDDLLKTLKDTHLSMHSMARQLNDEDYRTQYHQDLSPLGWHVGHCVFIETYWLREVILGDDSITNDLAWLYIPENIPKPERGPALPPIEAHLSWCSALINENALIFKQAPNRLTTHPLNKQNYILKFIIQHHSQHIETMSMVLAQRQLQLKPSLEIRQPIIENKKLNYRFQRYPAGQFNIGSPLSPDAFDNELPPCDIELDIRF